ncbi:hypothetical protein Tco_0411487 [Tanacetum coccineum]
MIWWTITHLIPLPTSTNFHPSKEENPRSSSKKGDVHVLGTFPIKSHKEEVMEPRLQQPVPSAALAGSIKPMEPSCRFYNRHFYILVHLLPPKTLQESCQRTNMINISSNESSSIQQNNPISTTLALTIIPPMASQTPPTQSIEILLLALRALMFSTLPSSPIEPHLYLTSLEDLPPRSTHPLPPLST